MKAHNQVEANALPKTMIPLSAPLDSTESIVVGLPPFGEESVGSDAGASAGGATGTGGLVGATKGMF